MIGEPMPTEVFGVVSVGHCRFAIPADLVMEAVPSPQAFRQLPTRQSNLHGYFQLRDRTLAVLDAPFLFGMDGPQRHPPEVLIIRYANLLYALGVDRIASVESVPSSSIVSITPNLPSTPTLFPRLQVDPQSGEVLGVLDVAALVASAGVVGTPYRENARFTIERGDDALEGHSHVVVRCGTRLLAFAALAVESISIMPTLRQPLPGSDSFLGIAEWRGMDVAVMALNVVASLPDAGLEQGHFLMVLGDGDKRAGFRLDELIELTEQGAPALLPVPPSAFAQPALVEGCIRTTQGAHALVINVAEMMSCPAVVHLAPKHDSASRSLVKAGTRDEIGNDRNTSSSTGGFLVFKLGTATMAARLGQVTGILRTTRLFGTRTDGLNVGLIEWHDKLIELLDLAEILQLGLSEAERQFALVVEHGTTAIALAIDGVVALAGVGEPAEVSTMGARRGDDQKMIVTLGDRNHRATYDLLDLKRIIALSRACLLTVGLDDLRSQPIL